MREVACLQCDCNACIAWMQCARCCACCSNKLAKESLRSVYAGLRGFAALQCEVGTAIARLASNNEQQNQSLKGDQAMQSLKEKYLIFSGEGEYGTWELTNPITAIGLKRRLTAERCNGDRWAHAYQPDALLFGGEIRLTPVGSDSGSYRSMARDELVALGYKDKELPTGSRQQNTAPRGWEAV